MNNDGGSKDREVLRRLREWVRDKAPREISQMTELGVLHIVLAKIQEMERELYL